MEFPTPEVKEAGPEEPLEPEYIETASGALYRVLPNQDVKRWSDVASQLASGESAYRMMTGRFLLRGKPSPVLMQEYDFSECMGRLLNLTWNFIIAARVPDTPTVSD